MSMYDDYYDEDVREGYFDDRDECYDYDEPDVDEFQENNDFAHDDDFDNYTPEDQHLDGMYEE